MNSSQVLPKEKNKFDPKTQKSSAINIISVKSESGDSFPLERYTKDKNQHKHHPKAILKKSINNPYLKWILIFILFLLLICTILLISLFDLKKLTNTSNLFTSHTSTNSKVSIVSQSSSQSAPNNQFKPLVNPLAANLVLKIRKTMPTRNSTGLSSHKLFLESDCYLTSLSLISTLPTFQNSNNNSEIKFISFIFYNFLSTAFNNIKLLSDCHDFLDQIGYPNSSHEITGFIDLFFFLFDSEVLGKFFDIEEEFRSFLFKALECNNLSFENYKEEIGLVFRLAESTFIETFNKIENYSELSKENAEILDKIGINFVRYFPLYIIKDLFYVIGILFDVEKGELKLNENFVNEFKAEEIETLGTLVEYINKVFKQSMRLIIGDSDIITMGLQQMEKGEDFETENFQEAVKDFTDSVYKVLYGIMALCQALSV